MPGPLTAALARGQPLLVLSPHLDDAVLSCGALLAYACRHAPVTVATAFTEGAPPPYTLSARRYLRQVGAPDAETLYRQRRAEDRAALEPLGITCVHAGLTEAQFRRRPAGWAGSRWARLLPELSHVYPVYRLHVISGQVAPADSGTTQAVAGLIRRLLPPGRSLVLAPLGIGGHVDHVLVRTAAAGCGARVAYYSDFPYNQRARPDPAFISGHRLSPARWDRGLAAKAALVRRYRTQVGAMFPGGRIPLVPEVIYLPGGTAG